MVIVMKNKLVKYTPTKEEKRRRANLTILLGEQNYIRKIRKINKEYKDKTGNLFEPKRLIDIKKDKEYRKKLFNKTTDIRDNKDKTIQEFKRQIFLENLFKTRKSTNKLREEHIKFEKTREKNDKRPAGIPIYLKQTKPERKELYRLSTSDHIKNRE